MTDNLPPSAERHAEAGLAGLALEPTAALYELAGSLPHAVTVLPLKPKGDRAALYSDASGDLVKLLRADGVDAGFLDPPADREWRVHMGEVAHELVIGISTGLISAATWEALKALARQVIGRKSARVTLVEENQRGDETSRTWFEVEGDGDVVAAAIEMLARRR